MQTGVTLEMVIILVAALTHNANHQLMERSNAIADVVDGESFKSNVKLS